CQSIVHTDSPLGLETPQRGVSTGRDVPRERLGVELGWGTPVIIATSAFRGGSFLDNRRPSPQRNGPDPGHRAALLSGGRARGRRHRNNAHPLWLGRRAGPVPSHTGRDSVRRHGRRRSPLASPEHAGAELGGEPFHARGKWRSTGARAELAAGGKRA